jgi:hypothetical protein
MHYRYLVKSIYYCLLIPPMRANITCVKYELKLSTLIILTALSPWKFMIPFLQINLIWIKSKYSLSRCTGMNQPHGLVRVTSKIQILNEMIITITHTKQNKQMPRSRLELHEAGNLYAFLLIYKFRFVNVIRGVTSPCCKNRKMSGQQIFANLVLQTYSQDIFASQTHIFGIFLMFRKLFSYSSLFCQYPSLMVHAWYARCIPSHMCQNLIS